MKQASVSIDLYSAVDDRWNSSCRRRERLRLWSTLSFVPTRSLMCTVIWSHLVCYAHRPGRLSVKPKPPEWVWERRARAIISRIWHVSLALALPRLLSLARSKTHGVFSRGPVRCRSVPLQRKDGGSGGLVVINIALQCSLCWSPNTSFVVVIAVCRWKLFDLRSGMRWSVAVQTPDCNNNRKRHKHLTRQISVVAKPVDVGQTCWNIISASPCMTSTS